MENTNCFNHYYVITEGFLSLSLYSTSTHCFGFDQGSPTFSKRPLLGKATGWFDTHFKNKLLLFIILQLLREYAVQRIDGCGFEYVNATPTKL